MLKLSKKMNLSLLALILFITALVSCGGGSGGGNNPASSTSKELTAFSFASPASTGIINESAKTVSVTVPYGTDRSALKAVFTTTGVKTSVGGVEQASGVTVNNFTSSVTYRVTAEDGSYSDYVVTVSVAASDSKDITSFTITGQSSSSISGTGITVTMPYGTDKTSLIPAITHTGASISPASGVEQDFTDPVIYTVTAADGSPKEYTVTVTVYPVDAKDIISFKIPGQSSSVISGTDITVTVPFGTDKTALITEIIHSGVSVSPASGVSQNFTSPVTYTVTDGASDTKEYTVTVKTWAKLLGGTGDDRGHSVCTDTSGNIYMVGFFQGTVDFGGGNMTSTGADIFIIKYSADGTYQWAKTFVGGSFDGGYSICTDSSGNVFVSGSRGGPNGSRDAFVVKYSGDGAYQWDKFFGGSWDDIAYSVCTDSTGNVYVAGIYTGAPDFGGGNVMDVGSSWNVFLVKYTEDGDYQWAKTFGGGGNDAAYSVCTDSSGNVYIAVDSQGGAIDFGGGSVTCDFSDQFIVKYTANGSYQWAKKIVVTTGSSWCYSQSLSTDLSGNVYVAGTSYGTMDFGGGNLTGIGHFDTFVAKYTSNGVYQWAKIIGGLDEDRGYSVCTDSSGNVYLTGYFNGTANFGSGNVTSIGDKDIFVTKYSSDGTYQWAKNFGGVNWDFGSSICTDISGNLYAIGYFQDTVNFGDGNVTSNGSTDIFLINVLNE